MFISIRLTVAVLFGCTQVIFGCPSGQVNLTADSDYRYFTSPGYPNPYSQNLDCKWMITAATINELVELEFIDSMIEDSGLCSNDKIIVYDGLSASYPELLKFCGVRQPSFHSTGRRLYVNFVTNNVSEYKGFRARYFQKPTSESSLSFGELVAIIGSVTVFLIVAIIIVACLHRKMGKEITKKLSRISSRGSKIEPVKETDSYPILPTKPGDNSTRTTIRTGKKKPARKVRDTTVTIEDLDNENDYPVLPTKPVRHKPGAGGGPKRPKGAGAGKQAPSTSKDGADGTRRAREAGGPSNQKEKTSKSSPRGADNSARPKPGASGSPRAKLPPHLAKPGERRR